MLWSHLSDACPRFGCLLPEQRVFLLASRAPAVGSVLLCLWGEQCADWAQTGVLPNVANANTGLNIFFSFNRSSCHQSIKWAEGMCLFGNLCGLACHISIGAGRMCLGFGRGIACAEEAL